MYQQGVSVESNVGGQILQKQICEVPSSIQDRKCLSRTLTYQRIQGSGQCNCYGSKSMHKTWEREHPSSERMAQKLSIG